MGLPRLRTPLEDVPLRVRKADDLRGQVRKEAMTTKTCEIESAGLKKAPTCPYRGGRLGPFSDSEKASGRITCPHCGATATIRPTGTYSWSVVRHSKGAR